MEKKTTNVLYEVASTEEAVMKVYERLVEDHQLGFEVGLTNLQTNPPMNLIVCMAIVPNEHAIEVAKQIGNATSTIMDSFFREVQ